MESFVQIIAFLFIVLLSILGNEKKRAAQLRAQREMRPPPRPDRRPDVIELSEEDIELVEPEKEPTSREEMLKIIRERMLPPHLRPPEPAPPPPPVVVAPPPPDPVIEGIEEEPDHHRRPSEIIAATELKRLKKEEGSAPARPKRATRAGDLFGELRTRKGLRRAMVAREVLGAPRALKPYER